MKLSTKTVASLLVSATIEASAPEYGRAQSVRHRAVTHFDRILHRHDRKGELCAELLGLSVYEFRRLQKKMRLDDIIAQCGIDGRHSFTMALVGKMRDELHARGWSRARIDAYVGRRSSRMAGALQLA